MSLRCKKVEEKFWLDFKILNFTFVFDYRFFNFISLIRNKNTFKTNKNSFEFKKSRFEPFSNKINYFLRLFIWFKKIFFFGSNTVLAKTKELIHVVLLPWTKNFVFIELNKIFLLITLCMYYATVYTFISLIERRKKNQEISLNQWKFSLTL